MQGMKMGINAHQIGDEGRTVRLDDLDGVEDVDLAFRLELLPGDAGGEVDSAARDAIPVNTPL
jgi:hypothetical protein